MGVTDMGAISEGYKGRKEPLWEEQMLQSSWMLWMLQDPFRNTQAGQESGALRALAPGWAGEDLVHRGTTLYLLVTSCDLCVASF